MSKHAIAVLMLLITACQSHAASAPSAEQCEQRIYSAPDGRLLPDIIARLPKSGDPVLGFEIILGRPLVAFPQRLLGFDGTEINQLSLPKPIKGISVNQTSRIELQTETGFQVISDGGFQVDRAMTNAVHGRLYDSGTPVSIEVRAHQNILQFVARKQNGSAFPIASLKGTLHAASWNEIGLAAVVGHSLYVWQAGAKNVLRLLTDQGLSDAKDVVLVGPGRAVVTMKNTIVLVTGESMTIVMKMSLARARYQQGVLYLLDTRTGVIWALRGLDQLGNRKDDQTYAMDLLRQVPKIGDRKSVQFLEAARIIGCSSAMQQLANLRSAH